jgi:glutathione S-transferase
VRVLRIPFSTNVDRVALALGHKGLEVEWVDVDPADRSPVVAASGQELVPVLIADDGEVVTNSTRILRWLEARHPDPPLWPAEAAARAVADVFCEWFDEVWKGPPNRLAEAAGAEGDADRMTAWLDRFEALLDGREHLLGDRFGVADALAFPFLVHGARPPAPEDTDPFHAVLATTMPLATGPYPRLQAWIERVDAAPRA